MRFLLFFYISFTTCVSTFAAGGNDAALVLPLVNKANLLLKKNNITGNTQSLLDSIYRLSEALDYPTGLAWYHLLEGKIAMFKADHAGSEAHYRKAMSYNESGERDVQIFASLYMNMGTLEVNKGNFEGGFTLCLKALNYANQIEDIKEKRLALAGIYGNMSRPFMNIGKYTKALFYLDKGLAIAEESESPDFLSVKLTILNNQGLCYQFLGDYKKAMHKYKICKELSIRNARITTQQTALANIGNVLIQQGKYVEAAESIQQALAIDDRSQPYYTTGILSALGNSYLHIGNKRKAEQVWLEALEIAHQFDLKNYLPELHLSLSDLYERDNRPNPALKHLKKYILIKDSISKLEQVKHIQQLEAKYQSVLKDKILAENLVVLQRRNNLIIILVGIGVLLLILAYTIFRHRSKLHKRKIRILEQTHEIDAVKLMMGGEEKERLRIARELHDGIGSMLTALNMKLNSIKKKHALKADGISSELDDPILLTTEITAEIRQTSRNLVPETLLHLGLSDTIRQYCSYLEIHNPILIDLQLYGNLDQVNHSQSLSLYRIIQEIVQNIIKHAAATEAVIQLRRHEDRVSLHAEDNGQGFDLHKEGKKGTGLANIKARVKAMKGYVSISSSAHNGTTIYIEMNIEKNPTIPFDISPQQEGSFEDHTTLPPKQTT